MVQDFLENTFCLPNYTCLFHVLSASRFWQPFRLPGRQLVVTVIPWWAGVLWGIPLGVANIISRSMVAVQLFSHHHQRGNDLAFYIGCPSSVTHLRRFSWASIGWRGK